MAAKNEITGAVIQSVPTPAYRANYDAIFRKPKEEKIEWPEDDKRMDIIGQNGNDGAAYERED